MLDKTTIDQTISKTGNSHVIVVTKACKLMDLKVGDIVRVTIERPPQ